MRYLVFKYSSYYPEGGMNDCVLKTFDRDMAIARAVHDRDVEMYHVHVYDTMIGEYVELPEED